MIYSSEADMAKHVVTYLVEHQWEVYQEVQPRHRSTIADIVATQGQLVWIVECKLRYGLGVIAQAVEWDGYAHYISVATPRGKGNQLLDEILQWKGLGRIEVLDREPRANVRIPAKLKRYARNAAALKSRLCDEHKTFAEAGNNYGRRYSPYQATCDAIRRFVTTNPGVTLTELIKGIDHHYASRQSATSSISHWAQHGKIKGIEAKRDGRNIRIYPSTAQPDDDTMEYMEIREE